MRRTDEHGWFKHIDFILIDLVSLYISFAVAYLIRLRNFGFVTSSAWRTLSVAAILIDILLSVALNPYSSVLRRRYYEDIVKSVGFVLANFVSLTIILYLFKIGPVYSRIVVVLMYAFYYCSSLALKYFWKKLIRKGIVRVNMPTIEHLLVLTDVNRAAATVQNIMASDIPMYEIVGLCLVEKLEGIEQINGVPIVGDIESFPSYAVAHNIPTVLVDILPGKLSVDAYKYMAGNGITIQLGIESMVGFETEQQSAGMVGIVKTLRLEEFSFTVSQNAYQVLKRVLDILFGLIGCILLLPVMVVVKLANLACGDHATIFYTQTRIGRDGKPFKLYKFRSMVSDAEETLNGMLQEEQYRLEWEQNQKFEHDPRITKVGRFIRRTSIDEMPQFINVLLGSMSLVGPRPLIEGELEKHGGLKLYYKVKPGITGWWACNGRSNIGYRERLDLEYYYIKHCSLYLDSMCLLRTVSVVLSRKGAQ